MTTKNPFMDDDEDENIFASPTNTNTTTVDNDDPFSVDSPSLFAGDLSTSKPTVSNTESQLERENKLLKEALRLKEQEVAEKDAELQKREREIEKYKPRNLDPDWPVCCPRMRHNIGEDVPDENQFFVRVCYFIWCLTAGTILLNWVAMVLLLGILCTVTCLWYPMGQDVVVSFVWIIIMIPMSLFFWYRPIYNGLRIWERSNFYWFFGTFSIHIVWATMMVVGNPGTGAAGFTLMSILLNSQWGSIGADNIGSDNSLAGAIVFELILVIICSCLWLINWLTSIWAMKLAYDTFKTMSPSAKEINAVASVGAAALNANNASSSSSSTTTSNNTPQSTTTANNAV